MKLKFVLSLLVLLFLVACGAVDAAPTAEGYLGASAIRVNDRVFTITGEVIGEIQSHQSIGAEGGGYMMNGYGSSYLSMWQEGKGFVRLKIGSISPESSLGRAGDAVILKSEDRKMMALLPGDTITVKCRIQYEVLSSVLVNETFSEEKQVGEFDYCRMDTPQILSTSKGAP